VSSAVVAHEVRKTYASFTAVDGVDVEVPRGVCFGFLGPNGAGKTTLMKMIYGLARVDGGTLTVLGLDVTSERRELKARIGIVPQDDNLDREFTVRQNLVVHGGYFGLRRADAEARADELLRFAELSHRAGARVQELSGGMRRRLLIVRALVNDPELVVLDEPTTGLDPQARITVWDLLAELRARGVTLLLTTHYMEEATRLCDRLVIMDRGRVVAEGTPAQLTERYEQPNLEGVFLAIAGRSLDA
jgi:lipooligosaccharide transport system ATP-binding protein